MRINLFDISLRLQNFPIGEARKELSLIQQNFNGNPTVHQDKKKWEIYQHHLNNNKAYKKFVGNTRLNNWEDIPILTKNDIQAPLSERLTEGYSGKNIHLHNTSGSSGTPFYFAKDKYCHAMTWAINYDRFAWHNIQIGKDIQGRFYGIPLSASKYYKEKIKDILVQKLAVALPEKKAEIVNAAK